VQSDYLNYWLCLKLHPSWGYGPLFTKLNKGQNFEAHFFFNGLVCWHNMLIYIMAKNTSALMVHWVVNQAGGIQSMKTLTMYSLYSVWQVKSLQIL
jgi:hypothetical protein